MKSINLNKPADSGLEILKVVMLFVVLALLWPLAQDIVLSIDPTSGYVDRSILILVLLALICFLGMIGLCWWLLKRFWMALGLPELGGMVLQFNELLLWQQLGFYCASFALLLLAGVGCLAAMC
ncbi:hypothetical protein [Pedobacter psychroterrae]|uniref:Uncharacterized protein n=1 Tax=Pedobacter psychroterrae TaxID=2530453 RepID=A0A4R0NRB6_9SPHI|nr:hypothetical protein [Pedobacter psychroterrae]TCD02719.1 hypothetical protein EZ437_01650 [Pedobacter psychroterrae]